MSHVIWECTTASITWSNLEEVYNRTAITPIVLSKNIITLSNSKDKALNTIITIIKDKLLSQKEVRNAISIQEINNLIDYQKRIELYAAKSDKGRESHRKRWLNFWRIT